MSNQENLYALQTVDSTIDRLNKQIEELPQKRELAHLEEKFDKLNHLLDKQTGKLEEINRDQKRLEDEVNLLAQKIKKEEERLFSGSITNPKELKSIQDELNVLYEKRDEQETALLEISYEAESVSSDVNRLWSAHSDFDRQKESLRKVVEMKTAEIESDLKIENKRRFEIVSKISADIIDIYERLRREKNGVAVARLNEITCLGCHLELPAQELGKMTNANEIWRCPHCRRVLVRVED